MSTESNKEIVRRFRDAFNAGDLEEGFVCFAPNAVVHMSSSPDPLPMAGFKQLGIPATGKSVAMSEMTIDKIADGRIVESWRLFDEMGMMQQLGVVPAPRQDG